MARFRPLSYEQWRDHMLANTSPDELVECPECHGDQMTECCECGGERECDNCDDGRVPLAELSPSQAAAYFSRHRYEAAVLSDGLAWARWCNTEPAEVMTAAGFLVASNVRTRRLEIVPPIRWTARARNYEALTA